MTRLNQLLAVEKGEKTRAYSRLTELHRLVQKSPLLSGITRTYQPKDEEGDRLPPESTRVQVTAEQTLLDIRSALTRLFDVTFSKDEANTAAQADIGVDGQVLLSSVPVTYLLFLEKQLTDLRTFVEKIPTLDPAENWHADQSGLGVYRTDPSGTVRTKKVPRNHVKAEATDRHPAQVDTYFEDVMVGTWTTVKFSGAMPATRRDEILRRITTLDTAVKFAREQANTVAVDSHAVSDAIFGYLFRD